MLKGVLFIHVLLAIVLGFPASALSDMASESYQIPVSVVGAAGPPIASESYVSEGTLGQPSPSAESDQIPHSASYDLFPGFWHSLYAAFPPTGCVWDLDPDPPDGDVDGSDLAALADGPFDADDLEAFASEFGRNDCLE